VFPPQHCVSLFSVCVSQCVCVSLSVCVDNTGSNVYVLDTRYIEIAVAQMTRYFESRDFLQNDALVYEGLFWTMAEQRVVEITNQAKIVDLNPTVTV